MHERSLVTSLLKQVDAIRREHDAESVTEVHVQIGPLSGVEPLLLAAAFEQLAPHCVATGAKLLIDEVTLRAECISCESTFEVNDFIFRCPTCGGNIRVTRGDDVQLVSVSLKNGASILESAL